ncbi:MAG: uroporphyrinogen decarboxylase family protein [Victivallaceae bacterium]|jgi:uroporphyrinogen decarboxylase
MKTEMDKRTVALKAMRCEPVPYTPWCFGFTYEAGEKLKAHYAVDDLETVFDNHILGMSVFGGFEDIGNDCYKDFFGVVWDRSEDKDIGVVRNLLIPEPALADYKLPPLPDKAAFDAAVGAKIEQHPDLLRMFSIGFSLFERAWTMRGMENLLMDMCVNPEFVEELLTTITDYNIEIVKRALEYDIDVVHFGDDWGQQHGLIMGPVLWKKFIYPQLKRIYGVVRDAGKLVSIHSCGDVDELFDDLVGIGLNNFNPFQPEVMDTYALMDQYRGRLSFWGGLSTQRTLPYGTVEQVVAESERLLEKGLGGGYIFAPAHGVEGDVPLENMLAFINAAQRQKGYPARQ